MRGEISAYKHTRIKSSKNCNTNFLQGENNKVVHIQIDNGGTWRKWKMTVEMKMMKTEVKKIDLDLRDQDIGILFQHITLTAEYLSGIKNTKASQTLITFFSDNI